MKRFVAISTCAVILALPLSLFADTEDPKVLAILQQLVSVLTRQLQALQQLRHSTVATSTPVVPVATKLIPQGSGLEDLFDGDFNPRPSCTLWLSPTSTVQGGTAALNWTSKDALWGYVMPIGSSELSGSKLVLPALTTTYIATFSGLGGNATCSKTLKVSVATSTGSAFATSTDSGSRPSQDASCIAFSTTYQNGAVAACTVQPGPGVSCPLGLPISYWKCASGSWLLSTAQNGDSCIVHRSCGDLVVPNGALARNSHQCGLVCPAPQQCVNGSLTAYVGGVAAPESQPYEMACPADPYTR